MARKQSKRTANQRGSIRLHPELLRYISPAVICILGIIAYANSFDCSFHFDDAGNIIDNEAIRNIGDIGAIWGFLNRRFVAYLTFALNYRLHGLDVFGYHVANLAIHLAASIFVWWLALLFFTAPWDKDSVYRKHAHALALGCGLLFVSHPVQTQAVTYIVQRLASLSAMFYILSVCLYIKGRLARTQLRSMAFFTACALSALVGIFTKETVFTLPFALLAVEAFFLSREKTPLTGILKNRRFLLTAIPFVLFLFILPALLSFNYRIIFAAVPSQRSQDPQLTSAVYLMTQFRVLVTYIRLLIVPSGQNLDYDFPASRSLFEPATFLSLLMLAALAVAAILSFRRYRVVSFGITWFFLTLSVESSVKPLGNVIFEHRMYLPTAGFVIAAVGLVFHLVGKRSMRIGAVLILAIVLCNTYLTYRRNIVWKDDLSLWSDTVAKSPNKSRPHLYLGLALGGAGRIQEAKEAYARALDIDPGYATAQLDMGNLFYNEGDFDSAITWFDKAIRAYPDYDKALRNLGRAYYMKGIYDSARAVFEKSLELDPDNTDVYNNIGLSYYNEGRFDEAKEIFGRAIEIDPGYIEPYINMGNTLAREGKPEEAETYFRQALDIDPENAAVHLNLGNACFSLGRYDEAIVRYLEALRINPDIAGAETYLGMAYTALGRTGEAVGHLRKALAKRDTFDARYLLGVILKDQGAHKEAFEHLSRAVELDPGNRDARARLDELQQLRGAEKR